MKPLKICVTCLVQFPITVSYQELSRYDIRLKVKFGSVSLILYVCQYGRFGSSVRDCV